MFGPNLVEIHCSPVSNFYGCGEKWHIVIFAEIGKQLMYDGWCEIFFVIMFHAFLKLLFHCILLDNSRHCIFVTLI